MDVYVRQLGSLLELNLIVQQQASELTLTILSPVTISTQ